MRAGTLVVDIQANLARLQKDMAEAKGMVSGAMNEISRTVNIAKGALAGLGAGVSVGVLASMAAQIVKSTAALDDMAEVTGSAVEELSKLQTVAKIGGHDFSLVEDSLVRLTKGLKGTDEETKNARQALHFLGIEAKTAAGSLRDPGEIMREVSQKLAQFEDGAGKTALALDLFGKSGAKLLPFLKDMAEEGAVAARVTGEQAAQAEKLEKALNRLQLAGEDARRNFLLPWIPGLTDVIEKLIAADKAAGGLAGALRLLAKSDPVSADRLAEIDQQIAAHSAVASARNYTPDPNDSAYTQWRKRGNSSMAKFFDLGGSLSAAKVRDLQRERAMHIALLGRNARGLTEDASGNVVVEPARPRADYRSTGGIAAGGAATGKTVQDVLNDLAGVGKDFGKDLALLHAEYTRGGIGLTEYRGAVEKLIEKQAFAKELHKQQAAEIKALTEAGREQYELEQRRGAQMIAFIGETGREIEQLEFENSLIGLSNVERDKAIALRKVELDLKKQSVGLSDEEAESLRREADAAKARLGTLIDSKGAREAAAKAAEDEARERERVFTSRSDNLTRIISDGLMNGFEKGSKSGAEVMIDTIKNALKSAVFEPVIHALISPVSRAVTGATMGMFGGSAFAGGGGGGGGFNPLSLVNSGSSLFGGAGMSLGVAEAASGLYGALGIGGASSIALGAEAAGVTSAALSGGALSGIGAALPWVGGALAVGSMLGLFGGGGGGPKNTDGLLGYDTIEKGVNVGINNAPGGTESMTAWARSTFTADKYDHEKIRELLGGINQPLPSVGPGDLGSIQQWISQFLEPARVDMGARAAQRTALQASLDPRGFYSGQMSTLQRDLGTDADTLTEWRAAFLAAMDGPLSQETFAKWQSLGAAIEGATGAAAGLAAALSPDRYSTVVDYRRAVLLAGGVPKFAGGVSNFGGGWAMTGEMGPELVRLPRGSSVYSNGESRRMLDNSGLEHRLERLEKVMTSVALDANRTARQLARFGGDGMPVRGVDPSTPLEVTSV